MDSTKKRLIVAGLAAVCVLLIFGISKVLYKEPVQTLPEERKSKEEVEVVVEAEDDSKVQEETEENRETEGTEETGEIEETKELVIEPETKNSVESGKQEIQPVPEKTENEKPEEPPALTEDANITNPDTPPVYKEPEETTQPADDTPSHGDTKDGMIYIDGFGWIPNEGGGGSGSNADDMYENGNKVGIMD